MSDEKMRFTISKRGACLGVPEDYPARFFRDEAAAAEFFGILTLAFAEAVEDIKKQLVEQAIADRKNRKFNQ